MSLASTQGSERPSPPGWPGRGAAWASTAAARAPDVPGGHQSGIAIDERIEAERARGDERMHYRPRRGAGPTSRRVRLRDGSAQMLPHPA
ncbi:hypothetical protein [Nonomuraea rubra]|uniref:hypothetical protein n=1 Tax=Nonomuraea rubra TaxID=46180 RepID=UPI0031EC9B9A